MSPAEAFGIVLRELRSRTDYSQEGLGHACDLHRTYVSMLERGLRSPTLDTIIALARALEVRPAEIIARVEEQLR
ncbi:MAG: helix-turn-helix transcriptional regulator [Planctomycetes bacterium]|nr:helix-turn-helix transcriptional regulator [Planctomycetota bacterium]